MATPNVSVTDLQKRIYDTLYAVLRRLHAEKEKQRAEEISNVIHDLELVFNMVNMQKVAICEYIPMHAYKSTWKTGKNFTDNPFIKID